MGEKQVIISVSREYGSGGHEIAKILSTRLGLNFYDRNMLDEIAKEKNVKVENLQKYDERRKNHFLSRTVKGHSSSPEENIAQMQFDFLKRKAEEGESFVIVGRCSETVLKEYEGLISFFICGKYDAKLRRVMERAKIDEKEAKAKIARHDRKRKAYHNHYSDMKWGDSRNYDICINSSGIGTMKTVDILEAYVWKRTQGEMIQE